MEPIFRSDVNDPQTTTPARRAPSIRRTSNVDMSFAAEGELLIRGACRDLSTTADGTTVLGSADIDARLGPRHILRSLTVTPSRDTGPLLGSSVGAGFRAKLEETFRADHAAGTPLYLLLDELPVAALISGYALLASGALEGGAGATHQADICAGWRSDGFMLVSIRTTGRMPTPVGPPAPALTPADDPAAWHELPPLAIGSMRRRRLVDVSGGDEDGPLDVFAMFRDSHVKDDGRELILHEYSLTAQIDPLLGVLTDCVAHERVLPWNECPAAAASAGRLDGRSLTEIRAVVRREFRGIETCTHLNDLLRSLGDLAVLAPLVAPTLRAGEPPTR